MSTAEIKWGQDGAPGVRQHNGRSNGTPPPEAALALEAYLAGLSPGARKRPAAVANRSQPAAKTVRAGYDATIEENVALALGLWRPMLPRELRVDTVAEFVDAARSLEATLRARPGGVGPSVPESVPDEVFAPRL